MSSKMCILVLAAVTALPIFASSVDDVIQLSQSGVAEEVVVAWANRNSVDYLTTADIVRMKDAKVSDRAIATIVHNAKDAPVLSSNGSSTTVIQQPTTTYVETPTYYSTPYYYDSYPYYRSYGYGYRPGVSFNFGFGGGYRGGYGGYRGGFGHRR